MRDRSEGRKRGFLRRFLKSQGGSAAVEFALIAGPFFFVLGSLAETGLMLFTEYGIQNAVQGAAREVRTHQVATETGALLKTATQFKADLCSKLHSLINCNSYVTVYVNNASNFATLKTTMPNFIAIGPGGPSSYSPGASLRAVGVIATYDWDFAFPFMDFLGNISGGSKRRLHGVAIFTNEP